MTNTDPKSASFLTKMAWLIRENPFFFGCFLAFVVVGGFGGLMTDQGDLLLYFSRHRTEMGDVFFKIITQLGEEWFFLGLTVLFIFIRLRYALLIPLTGLVVTLISFVSKAIFQHPRPSVYYRRLGTLEEINLVEGVYLLGGPTSFPSGHTMAAFAVFTLLALFAKRKKGWAILMFAIALLVGLSRVYLVLHFWKDVYAGGIAGVVVALLVFAFQQNFPEKKHSLKSIFQV